MTVLSQLKRDLEDASSHVLPQAAAPSPQRPRRRRRRPPLITVLPVAVTLAVVAVVVLALASGSSITTQRTATGSGRTAAKGIGPKPPNPGPAPGDVDQKFLTSVENSVTGRDRACAIQIFNAKPDPDSGTPSAQMLSVLPALTRLPEIAPVGNNPTLRGEGVVGAMGVYTRWVRLARSVDGLKYYLVPVAHAGTPPTPVAAADRCYSAQVSAVRAGITELPLSERASTLRYGEAELAVERYDSETTSVHEGVLLFSVDRRGDGNGEGGLTPGQIERSGEVFTSGGPGGVRTIEGIVPAGIARVTLILRGHGVGANLTAKVVNDVFVMHLPEGMGRLARMVWISPSGQTIRSIDESSLGA